MAWPLRMRVTSVAVTAYIALIEFAIAALPLGMILWLSGLARPASIVSIGWKLAAAWAIVIVMLGHVWPFSSRLGSRLKAHALEDRGSKT